MGLLVLPLTVALEAIWVALEVAAYVFELIDRLIGWALQTSYESRVTACLKRAGATVKACRYA